MAVIGTLSSVNLIAGAGILGNIGGIPIGANSLLLANINSYTSINVVSTFANIANSGYVTINIVANTFPSLTNAIPTAYQANLGNGTMTSAITSQNSAILGSGDLGKFQQVLNASLAYVAENNQLIISTINANNLFNLTGFSSQDQVVTGGFSDLTLALNAFSRDLIQTGFVVDFSNLDNLGTPAALLRNIATVSFSTPALNDALLAAGVPADIIDNLSDASWTDAVQKRAYQAMTTIVGTDLDAIKQILRVTTPNLSSMADLLNPVKLFPNSFNSFTAPTNNGLRAIYIDSRGQINSELETILPANVLVPLQGIQTNSTPYSRLSQIIPSDQALANKAMCAALQQVATIFESTAPLISGATANLETNYGLGIINALTTPLPPNVVTYFTDTLAQGSGEYGLFLLTDLIGTPTGVIATNALSNTTAILNTLNSAGAFDSLTNGSNGVYTVMNTTISGAYTTFDSMSGDYTTTIPGGLPGAGSYVANSSGASIANAFSGGLNPAMTSAVANIVSIYPTQVAQTTQNFGNICVQIITEDTNQNLANIDFANLQPNVKPYDLVYSLNNYGLDTVQGGAAFVMESLANTATMGGQAIISTMRAARNQVRLSNAAISTNIVVSDEIAQPTADLGQSQYTVSEASQQKII